MAATMVLFGVHAFGQNGNNCENLLGDVNGDGYINILDLLLTKNQVLQDSSPTDCADSYIDGVIDVSDVAVTLMEIFGMSENSGSCPDIAFYFEQESDNVLSLSFSVQSTPNFVSGLGLQMAISNLPPASSIVSVSSGDLEMSYSAENDLVLGCSLFGQSFLENGAEDVLTIEFSEAVSASELLGEILLPFCGDSFVTSFAESSGCMDESACNFFEFATLDDGSCVYDDACGICDGDNSSCSGCTHDNATNYNPTAVIDDGSCLYSQSTFEGTCGPGTVWDESTHVCVVANVSDTDFDGCVGINDFLVHLSNFGSGCGPEPAWSCGDPLEYQGYDYETVQIGEQCWFAENLRSESYRNGDIIPVVPGSYDWLNQIQGAKCWHNNDSMSWGFPGFLYNGYAVNDPRSLCPQSWHVANDSDWAGVEMSHGLSQEEAFINGQRGSQIQLSQKMRDESWGFNELGLGIMPGGYREWDTGSFSSGVLVSGIFWSNGPTSLKYRECHGPWSGVARGNVGVLGGLSVRCIKDSE